MPYDNACVKLHLVLGTENHSKDTGYDYQLTKVSKQENMETSNLLAIACSVCSAPAPHIPSFSSYMNDSSKSLT